MCCKNSLCKMNESQNDSGLRTPMITRRQSTVPLKVEGTILYKNRTTSRGLIYIKVKSDEAGKSEPDKSSLSLANQGNLTFN